MVSVVRKDTGNFMYMRLKKHNCPECGKQMKIVKMVKVVKSKTKEANNLNISACEGERVKFIWYEFQCKDCGKNYSEETLKPIEKRLKKQKKEEEKAAKKAAKQENSK